MSLRYCLKCKRITSEKEALQKETFFFCRACSEQLVYFGREPVWLSPKPLRDKYDEKNPINPIDSFNGRFNHFFSPKVDLEILECEDMLKSTPDNIEALTHLATLFKARNDLEKAKSYLLSILKVDEEHVESHKSLADIFLTEKQFSQAVSAIELVILLEGENSENLFNLGVATMCAGELEGAVGFYQKAFELCKDTLRKNQIENILNQVRIELKISTSDE